MATALDSNPNFNLPPAYMGYVGFVKILAGLVNGNSQGVAGVSHDPYLIRATSAEMNLSQEVSKPDVIDSRYDRSVYQLGPKVVDGSLAFPVVYEIPTGQTVTLFELLYRYAATRTDAGLLSDFNMDVKYAASATSPFNEAEFTYVGCIVNTWQFSVAQSDVVTCSIDVMGVDRIPNPGLKPPTRGINADGATAICTDNSATSDLTASQGVTRIVTWNDARVQLDGGRLPNTIGGQQVRTFEANINNDAERYYSLNAKLFAQSIAPRKREVSGNVVLIGRNPDLAQLAVTNQEHCTEYTNVKFGYSTPSTGDGCSESTFNVTLPNCVFEIETMSLTNDIFESTVNWHSLPNAGTGVCDPLLSQIGEATFDIDS